MTTWVDVEVKVSPHRSLNMSKGIIRCRDLRDCSEEEVLDAQTEGVTNVKHIFANKNGAKQPTNTFVLTFAKPAAIKFVKAAYLKIPVEMFIPNPLRCFNCQRFGHGKNSCNRPAICASAVNRATWMQTARKSHVAPTVQVHIRHSPKNARNGLSSVT
jgi:hypothetical protein